MDNETSLSSGTRQFIVLCALLQGLLLYLVQAGTENAWWPFSELSGVICWYSLVLTVPSMICLSIVRLSDRRFWLQILGVAVVVGMLATWAAWSATGAPDLRSSSVLGPFGTCLALGTFVVLPYLQCRVQHGKWCAPYTELFERSWQNGLVIVLIAIFVGLCWGLLTLCSSLFKLIGIRIFQELFDTRAFIYLATGVMVGLGILVARVQQSPVRVARQIVLSVFKGLLPVLAIVALMFLAALLFTGLEGLWKTRYATATLFWLLILLVVMTNAVFQDGRDGFPYPKVFRRIVEVALIAMPLFCGIALYALWLRIAQYGWTQECLFGVLIGVLLAGYSLGYAFSVFRSRAGWLPLVPRINIVVSLVALGLVALVNSPILDPHRITVNSQISRYQSVRVAAGLDARHLRFNSGRRGYEALVTLRDVEREGGDTATVEKIERALAESLKPWERANPNEKRATPTLEFARERIKPVGGEPAPEDDYLEELISGRVGPALCLDAASDCILLRPDFDADGEAEHLLCAVQSDRQAHCDLTYREQGHWKNGGTILLYGETKSGEAKSPDGIIKQLRTGGFTIKPHRWGDLYVDGRRFHVQNPGYWLDDIAESLQPPPPPASP